MKHIDIPDHLVRGPVLSERDFDFVMNEIRLNLGYVGLSEYTEPALTAAKINADLIAKSMMSSGYGMYGRFIGEAYALRLLKLVREYALNENADHSIKNRVDAMLHRYRIDEFDDHTGLMATYAVAMIAEDRKTLSSEEALWAAIKRNGDVNGNDQVFLHANRRLIGRGNSPQIAGWGCGVSDDRLEAYVDGLGNIASAYFALIYDIPMETMAEWREAVEIEKSEHLHAATVLLLANIDDDDLLEHVISKLGANNAGAPFLYFGYAAMSSLFALAEEPMSRGILPSRHLFDLSKSELHAWRVAQVHQRYQGMIAEQAAAAAGASAQSKHEPESHPITRSSRISI